MVVKLLGLRTYLQRRFIERMKSIWSSLNVVTKLIDGGTKLRQSDEEILNY